MKKSHRSKIVIGFGANGVKDEKEMAHEGSWSKGREKYSCRISSKVTLSVHCTYDSFFCGTASKEELNPTVDAKSRFNLVLPIKVSFSLSIYICQSIVGKRFNIPDKERESRQKTEWRRKRFLLNEQWWQEHPTRSQKDLVWDIF